MHSTEATRQHAQDILDFIHEHPEHHDQTAWVAQPSPDNLCGTSMCIAGTSLFLKEQWVWNDSMQGPTTVSGRPFDSVARMNLGLTLREAQDLFYEMNNESAVQKLKHIVVGEDWPS